MNKNNSNQGRVTGFIFGLVFFLSGAFAVYSIVGQVTVRYISSLTWEQVPATITYLKLDKRRSKKSTYFQVKTQYTYSFQGVEYQGDSVSLNNERDSFGSYWQDLYQQLKQDKKNASVVAFINPNDPSDVLLDRTFRGFKKIVFGGMFLFIFCGLGLFMMWACAKPIKQPEQIRQDAKNGVKSDDKAAYWGVFGFGALFFIPGAGIFILALPTIIDEGKYEGLTVLIFAFFGAWLMVYALINQYRYKAIGSTPLFLDPLPGAIGGQVGGSFTIAYKPQNKLITIKLNCKKHVRNKDDSSRIEVIWQRTTQAYVEQTSNGFHVKFLFDCPADLPSSNSETIFWELHALGQVMIKSSVIKLDRRWTIPVEKVEPTLSSIHIPAYYSEQQNELKEIVAQDDIADLVQFDKQNKLIEVNSRRECSLVNANGDIFMSFSLVAIGLYTVSKGWPWFGYFWVLIGALVFGSYLSTLGRYIYVKIDTKSRILYMSKKMFGLVFYKREVDIFDSSQFCITSLATITEKDSLIDYYNIEIKCKGERVLVVESIKGKEAANATLNSMIKNLFPECI